MKYGVGIDVSKGKSTVAILSAVGEVIEEPFEINNGFIFYIFALIFPIFGFIIYIFGSKAGLIKSKGLLITSIIGLLFRIFLF